MNTLKRTIVAAGALIVASVTASAQTSYTGRAIEPSVMIGCGLYMPGPVVDSEYGAALSIGAGVDFRVTDSWSVMTSVMARTVSEFSFFASMDGADPDCFKFLDFGISGRYHISGGPVVGLGPFLSRTTDADRYYIDADPTSPLGDQPKVKGYDYGLQPSVDFPIGRHFKVGLVGNIGLRNMRITYPDYGASAPLHINSFTIVAGFRF